LLFLIKSARPFKSFSDLATAAATASSVAKSIKANLVF
jgi:hypothetical protein